MADEADLPVVPTPQEVHQEQRLAQHVERVVEEHNVSPDEVIPVRRPVKSDAAAIAERRISVYTAVICHGIPPETVALELGVSEKTVKEDLKVIRERSAGEWKDARKNPERRLEALADITNRLDVIFQNAMLSVANCDGGDENDRRAAVQFLKIAMESTTRKAAVLDGAGCLPKSADGQAPSGGSFEINLKASFGADASKVGPAERRRVLEMVRLISSNPQLALNQG